MAKRKKKPIEPDCGCEEKVEVDSEVGTEVETTEDAAQTEIITVRVKRGYRLFVDGKFYGYGHVLTVSSDKVADQTQKFEVI